jgi:hypothetical protein
VTALDETTIYTERKRGQKNSKARGDSKEHQEDVVKVPEARLRQKLSIQVLDVFV